VRETDVREHDQLGCACPARSSSTGAMKTRTATRSTISQDRGRVRRRAPGRRALGREPTNAPSGGDASASSGSCYELQVRDCRRRNP
jgi:hypothetical protein